MWTLDNKIKIELKMAIITYNLICNRFLIKDIQFGWIIIASAYSLIILFLIKTW